jgi:hypothetical protein
MTIPSLHSFRFGRFSLDQAFIIARPMLSSKSLSLSVIFIAPNLRNRCFAGVG